MCPVSETPSITEGESIRRLPGGLNVCTYCFARGWPKPHHFDFCIWKNGTEVSAVGEHKHDYIETVLCSYCMNELLDKADERVETIARLERERDKALQERQRFENMYSDQVDSASQFANELDDTNKLLDEARGVRDHYIRQYARAVDLLKEADALTGAEGGERRGG